MVRANRGEPPGRRACPRRPAASGAPRPVPRSNTAGIVAGVVVAGLVLIAVGTAIGQILTAPFSAGVIVLLYTDRRIRAEAFDLVLHTGAAEGPGVPADSTDHLWLIRRP